MDRALTDRVKAFAVRVVRLCATLPRSNVARVLGNQVLRSGTSVGAHCREAFRSRSNAELISKLEVALQELDETSYWFELLMECEIVTPARLTPLHAEANELTAILVTSVRTLKQRRR